MKTIFVLLFMAISWQGYSQIISFDQDTVRWDVVQLTDRNTNEVTGYTCYFISYGDDMVKWVQGDYVLNLDVQSDKGSWSDISKSGNKKYKVTLEGKTGDLTFTRDGSGLSIQFSFPDGSADSMPYTFLVQSAQKLN